MPKITLPHHHHNHHGLSVNLTEVQFKNGIPEVKDWFLFGRPLAYMEFGLTYSDKNIQLQRTQKAVIEMVVPFLRSRMTTVTHRMTPTGTNSSAPMNRDVVTSFDVIVTSSSEVTGRRGDVM